MVIGIYGTDTYRSRAHVAQLVEKFKKDRDPQGLNVDKIDAETVSVPEALGRIFASPFLAEKRMVVVERLIEKGSEELEEALTEKIKAGAISESLILIIWEAKDDFKKNTLFELIKKEKFSQRFEELEGAALVRWAQDELTKHGVQFERGVAEKISQVAGSTQEAVHLIHQLASYTAEQTAGLTVEDVDLFKEEKIDDNIFALVDALGVGNKKKCFELLEDQWNLGANEHYIFSMLVRQFRIIAGLFFAQEEGDPTKRKALQDALALHPFVMKKTQALLPKYSSKKIATIYEQLLAMDKAGKTGGNLKILLTSFIETL
jgi:DNA polymerase-3 subunit delta